MDHCVDAMCVGEQRLAAIHTVESHYNEPWIQ